MKHKTHCSEDDLGSFGISVKLSFERKLSPSLSAQMMAALVRSLASAYMSKVGPGVLRIKTFFKGPAGYIKTDITGANREPFTELNMNGSVKTAELTVNIIAQRLSDEETKALFIEVVENILVPLKGQFEIVRKQIKQR